MKLVNLTGKYICQPLFVKLRYLVLGTGVKLDGRKKCKGEKYKMKNDK